LKKKVLTKCHSEVSEIVDANIDVAAAGLSKGRDKEFI
jgi:hypothetical protein